MMRSKGLSNISLKKIAQQMDSSFQTSKGDEYFYDVLQVLEDAVAAITDILQKSERLGYDEDEYISMNEHISALMADEFNKPLYRLLQYINNDHGLKDQIQHIYNVNTDESYARLF